jgi:tetratricopeptide (TPR) repeat protein
MSMSDMAVFAASQYRNLGSIDQARDELRNAIEIWPSNPAIREFQLETTKLATAGSQGERIFDDLFKRGDMRGIYERRMELGFALSGDEVRRPKLLEVIDQVATVEMYLAQAAELKAQGEDFAAWELLEMARKIDADDSPMNRARAELAPRVANFVGAVDRAAEAESDRNYASALTAYLAAQDTYPASRICRLGIERSSTALMANLSEQMNAERAEMTDPSADEFISE